MSDELDLRAVLRSRAAMAPDPDTVIGDVRRLARRRQIRRRVALGGGVLVLTALVLAATTLLGRSTAPIEPIEPAGDPVVGPTFPFSVSPVLDGLRLSGWTSDGNPTTGQSYWSNSLAFDTATEQVQVQLDDADPTLLDTPTGDAHWSPAQVHGGPASVFLQSPSYWRVAWQVGQTSWLDVLVSTPGSTLPTEQHVLAIADAVTMTPTTPQTTLRIPHAPVGFRAFGWLHGGLGGQPDVNEVELCPRVMIAGDEGSCFHVASGDGPAADARSYMRQRVSHVRQIDPTRWVGIVETQVPGLDAAQVAGLLRSMSLH